MRSAVLAALVVALAVAPLAEAVGEPKQAITKADQARARSVLLQRGDLGAGFVARRQTDSVLPDDPKCRRVAFRLVARLTAGATTATVYFDAVVVQRGRIQTGIVFTSVGRPIPRSEATTLARVVAKRLATAAGASSGPVA